MAVRSHHDPGLGLDLEDVLDDSLNFLAFDVGTGPSSFTDSLLDDPLVSLPTSSTEDAFPRASRSNAGPYNYSAELMGNSLVGAQILDSGSNSMLFAPSAKNEENLPSPHSQLSRNNLESLSALNKETNTASIGVINAKIGGRFSRDAVRILRGWLSLNSHNPYPSESDKKWLQEQTGLNKTQIMNWLANARRRKAAQLTRSSSPLVLNNASSRPMDIPPPPRQGTPAPRSNPSNLNPLERWVDSPPENEPATVTAIARAVASSRTSRSSSRHSRDGSDGSIGTANSLGTPSSLASTNSAASHTSLGSFGAFNPGRSRRRKRARFRNRISENSLAAPSGKPFQCTFCTETFRTRHDWQRHENSLHLPLERWLCAPHGPIMNHPETGESCCVFCGLVSPDEGHIQSHNFFACEERTVQERMFNRKDHLNQHLRLVHDVKFKDWPMKSWKMPTPLIRSRCGFCGVLMNSWEIRVHHLSDHFKAGKTMGEWKGDWGFDAEILNLVENSIPPYLVESERQTPFPFRGSQAPAETPRSAYELIKLELAYFMQTYFDKTSRMPNDEEMHLEAVRIVLASEARSHEDQEAPSSWLRDLIMLSNLEILKRAKFSPLRSAADSRLHVLRINGKQNLFEGCLFESQLRDFVSTNQLLGLPVMENELMEEASRVVGRVEQISVTPSNFIAIWLTKLIHTSSGWIKNFCERAEVTLQPSDEGPLPFIRNWGKLDQELAAYLRIQQGSGHNPDNAELQKQARIIIYGSNDDDWRTPADDELWVMAFRQRHSLGVADSRVGIPSSSAVRSSGLNPLTNNPASYPLELHENPETNPRSFLLKNGSFFLNDANFYKWMADDLERWVTATMSPENPACHVPSDEEIQHYARCIAYNDDDPWNQTVADNEQWLTWFKQRVGLDKIAQEPATNGKK